MLISIWNYRVKPRERNIRPNMPKQNRHESLREQRVRDDPEMCQEYSRGSMWNFYEILFLMTPVAVNRTAVSILLLLLAQTHSMFAQWASWASAKMSCLHEHTDMELFIWLYTTANFFTSLITNSLLLWAHPPCLCLCYTHTHNHTHTLTELLLKAAALAMLLL